MADHLCMVATTHNGRRTTKGKAATSKTAASDAANGPGIGDLGTIQSILFGEFSKDADTRFGDLEGRIRELEAELATARGAHTDSVREHNQALGQVKADLTRTKKSTADLFEEQDAALRELQTSSVDKTVLADALRAIADQLVGDA